MRAAIIPFIVAGLAAGFVAAGPGPLQAAPRVSSELASEFQAGVDAYRLGRYDDARRHLDKATALDPKLPGPHRFLAALARAQQRWTECVIEARRALQLQPRSAQAADTRKLHDGCRAALGRPGLRTQLGDGAAIAVVTNVAGATVRIDGLGYGSTPVAPRRIKPGRHELDVIKPGYRPAHRSIDALPGIVTDVEIALAQEPPPPPPTSDRPRISVH